LLSAAYGQLVWADLVTVLSDVAGAGLSSVANQGLMAHVAAGSALLWPGDGRSLFVGVTASF
jgi:hypothetical protein